MMGTVAVVGAGTMGSGIAQVCAHAGNRVRLVDVDPKALYRARETIRRRLDGDLAADRISAADREGTLSRIEEGTDLDAFVRGAQVVIEAAPERRELKGALWHAIDAAADEGALLASNTSSISISWLAVQTARGDRVVGIHFFNPVPRMALVEVVRGRETSDATTAEAQAFVSSIGKIPVVVRDSPGFVSNRVLMPMINEAIYCVMEQIADPGAVDQVMKLGMRHPMGPLALADLIGLDVCLDIINVLYDELGDEKYKPCPLLSQMVAGGKLGRKTGRGFYDYALDEQ